MALSTYSELKTAVSDWLNRSDLSARVEDFIAIAEADLNRRLRHPRMENTATLTLTAGTADYDLLAVASDFIALRDLVLVTDLLVPLAQISPQQFAQRHAFPNESGVPEEFMLSGTTVTFGPTPDAAYTCTMRYFAKLPDLKTNNTNWLLSLAPDVYLYGALVAATPFIEDDQRLPVWSALYEKSLTDLMTSGLAGNQSINTRATSEMGAV